MAQGNHQSQAKSFFIPIFLLKQWEKRGKGKFGHVWASLDNLGQVWASQGKATNWKNGGKGMKNKKREQKFEW